MELVLPIDPAIKYCLGAPSFSAPFAEKGGKAMSLFSCRINKSAAIRAFLIGTLLFGRLFRRRRVTCFYYSRLLAIRSRNT
jgi:hypothetical protein